MAASTLKYPARSDVPIEINIAIEAAFTVPPIACPLRVYRLTKSECLQFGNPASHPTRR
jgi:hypothetical protein